jgi:hypothetical protein
MSITKDGQLIQCDGEGCDAVVRLPVGLRSTLTRERRIASEQPEGWLFAMRSGHSLHYCPNCKAKYLTIVVNEGR